MPPIYTIKQDNVNQILPSLPLASVVKQNISDAVLNSGWIAVVPRTGLQVNQWFGYGWQIIDPNSGAAAYFTLAHLVLGHTYGFNCHRSISSPVNSRRDDKAPFPGVFGSGEVKKLS
jgi:hypothetical protein